MGLGHPRGFRDGNECAGSVKALDDGCRMRDVEGVEFADKVGDRSKALARFDGGLRVVLKEPDGVEDLSIELRSEECGRCFQMLALALGIGRGHAL